MIVTCAKCGGWLDEGPEDLQGATLYTCPKCKAAVRISREDEREN